MRYLSVCSGIEAASVAWGPLGWQAVAFSEIEPFPSAVLAHHYPDVPNLGDMTTVAQRILNGEVEAPDVLAGGTPCQSFSIAGLRKSLSDERGNLTLKFVELADAIDYVRVRDGRPPAIVFWENVPGVLSTKDNAFGCFLGALAGEDCELKPPGKRWADAGCVFGPQRAIAWRILDAQYFGLAQRRRRVFVVASAREGFDPAKVLFEFEGVRRDTPPSREARQTAPTIPSRSTGGGGLGTDFDRDGGLIHVDPIARCDTAGEAKRQDWETCNFVAHSLRTEGFDASEDGTGRGTPLGSVAYGIRTANTSSNGWGIQEECTHTLDCAKGVAVAQPVAFAQNSRNELRLEGGDGQRTGALSTGGGKPGQGVPMIAFPANLSGTQRASTDGFDASEDVTGRSSGSETQSAHRTYAVRRLTVEECESLQGFPRGYTRIPWRGKPADQCPDGPRYKALGNSWAVPVVRWIGERINAAVEQIKRDEALLRERLGEGAEP